MYGPLYRNAGGGTSDQTTKVEKRPITSFEAAAWDKAYGTTHDTQGNLIGGTITAPTVSNAETVQPFNPLDSRGGQQRWTEQYGKTHNTDGTLKGTAAVENKIVKPEVIDNSANKVEKRPITSFEAAAWDKAYGTTHDTQGNPIGGAVTVKTQNTDGTVDAFNPLDSRGGQQRWIETYGKTHNKDGTLKATSSVKDNIVTKDGKVITAGGSATDVPPMDYEENVGKPLTTDQMTDLKATEEREKHLLNGEAEMPDGSWMKVDEGDAEDGVVKTKGGYYNIKKNEDGDWIIGDKAGFIDKVTALEGKAILDDASQFFDIKGSDVSNFLKYYLGSRIVGGSHEGSLNWAGKRALKQNDTRVAEDRKELKTVKKGYRDHLQKLKKSKLLSDKGYTSIMESLNGDNVVAMEEAFNNVENYSGLHRAGVRPGDKTISIQKEGYTRPIEAYDLGNGQYVDKAGNVYDHSKGYSKAKTDDQRRDDVHQLVEDIKVYTDKGKAIVKLTEEDQVNTLWNISKLMKQRGRADDPLQWTSHMKDSIDAMQAANIPLNKQNLESYLMGTIVMGDAIDYEKIQKKDKTLASSGQMLTFGDNTAALFKQNKPAGFKTVSAYMNGLGAGYDPKNVFNETKVLADVAGTPYANLIKNAPTNYMKHIYWSAWANAK